MNYQTCYALVKREYYETRNSIFWIFLLTLIILVIHTLPNIIASNPIDIEGSIKPIYLIVGGIIASSAFWEFKSTSTSNSYLLIPANSLEKVTAKIIFYVIGWFMLFIICFSVANILTISKMSFITSTSKPQLIILNSIYILLQSFLQALLIQSITIFASCYFKRKVLIKLFCIYIVMVLPFNYMHNILYGFNQKYSPESNSIIILVKICIILALWIITWLRLKETEGK